MLGSMVSIRDEKVCSIISFVEVQHAHSILLSTRMRTGGRRDLRDVPVGQVEAVVKVNLLGILLCTKVAMDIMGEQVRMYSEKFWFLRWPFFCDLCLTLVVGPDYRIVCIDSGRKNWAHLQHSR